VVIIFDLIWFLSKTNNQTELKKKQTETGSNQRVSVRFIFWKKPVWLGLFLI
jgi:hypothetical protein